MLNIDPEVMVTIFITIGVVTLGWFVYSVMNDDDIGPPGNATMFYGSI